MINGTGDDDNGSGDDDNGSGDDDNGAGNDDGDEYNSSAVVKMLKRCVRFRGFKFLALGKLCQQIIIIPLIPSHALYRKKSSKSQMSPTSSLSYENIYHYNTFTFTSENLLGRRCFRWRWHWKRWKSRLTGGNLTSLPRYQDCQDHDEEWNRDGD